MLNKHTTRPVSFVHTIFLFHVCDTRISFCSLRHHTPDDYDLDEFSGDDYDDDHDFLFNSTFCYRFLMTKMGDVKSAM